MANKVHNNVDTLDIDKLESLKNNIEELSKSIKKRESELNNEKLISENKEIYLNHINVLKEHYNDRYFKTEENNWYGMHSFSRHINYYHLYGLNEQWDNDGSDVKAEVTMKITQFNLMFTNNSTSYMKYGLSQIFGQYNVEKGKFVDSYTDFNYFDTYTEISKEEFYKDIRDYLDTMKLEDFGS